MPINYTRLLLSYYYLKEKRHITWPISFDLFFKKLKEYRRGVDRKKEIGEKESSKTFESFVRPNESSSLCECRILLFPVVSKLTSIIISGRFSILYERTKKPEQLIRAAELSWVEIREPIEKRGENSGYEWLFLLDMELPLFFPVVS